MSETLPLAGIRVVEFTHMVMGPTCGMILADLGAEVIKVEPLAGDNTRRLLGSGAGFYPMFNRNKKSISIDVKNPIGREIILKLVAGADVFSENFKSGTMDKLGFGYSALSKLNPSLIYVSHKGFLPGPYDNRTALDEVVQMMGGLAYMTGPAGQPLRAGASVNDIMGGMFGAIGVLASLQQRNRTGHGQEVASALFENNVFLVAQHMMQFAVTGKPANPMPNRLSAWAVYDVFTVKDGEQIFLSAVSDTQWALLCKEFAFDDLKADTRLGSNNERVQNRSFLIPILRERFAALSAKELSERFEKVGLPYAPITRPHELFDDPHLLATGGLAPVTIAADNTSSGKDIETRAALLPLALNDERLRIRNAPPRIGADTIELLQSLGYSNVEIDGLRDQGIIRSAEPNPQ
ncbi:CoA transferase [Alcaligenaceae bacterium LF4-65]|uniref:CoA transferase n=1 Tax=Zwartia hollandica TaxID=324606 RepID=A0A953NBD2_9BURK|nr:CaiB/BaiF CoA-transferase family protein [Zwartia hollandica]MBZ1351970.1 CoA transferase [Zwartia hollandica]